MNKELKKLDPLEVKEALSKIKDWDLNEKTSTISKEFTFKGYYKTIAFVNSIAWLAQKTVHHPDLTVSFGKCKVSMTTHDVDGLSYKDFYMAKEIDTLFF